ncbi:MAG: hypothetical protein ACK5PB_16705 [Pirellula sp.]
MLTSTVIENIAYLVVLKTDEVHDMRPYRTIQKIPALLSITSVTYYTRHLREQMGISQTTIKQRQLKHPSVQDMFAESSANKRRST